MPSSSSSSSSSLQWLSLVGIIWLQSINGTNTDFPAYSSQLKHLLSISQVQLNNLAFASDAGKFFGWISGIAAIHLPLWLVLVIGAILGLIGYGLQFLCLVNKITSLSYLQVFILTVFAGNSICWINTVCYVVTISNFPSDRQIAVGVSTSYVGLSAMFYTALVDFNFGPTPMQRAKAYLLLNSIVPLAISIVCSPLTRVIETGRNRKMDGGFAAMFFVTVVTGIYSVFVCVGSATSGLSPVVHAVILVALLASPLLIVAATLLRECLQRHWWTNCQRRVCDFIVDENGVGEILEIEMKEGGGELSVREEIGVKLMVRRMEFWLYFFVYMFGATLGLVYMNNLGQIAESRGQPRASSLVSLSSSFGFFGRLTPSLLDYFFSKSRYMVSRPACIATLMIPLSASFFLLLVNQNVSLYISTATIGVCTGAITSIAVSMTPELFGTKNFSVNHNVVVANIPIGSFLFGYLAALLYQGGDKGHGRCIGQRCYNNTFIIWGSICSIGTLLSFILYVRTCKFYLRKL